MKTILIIILFLVNLTFASDQTGLLPESFDGRLYKSVTVSLPSQLYILIRATESVPENIPSNIRTISIKEHVPDGNMKTLTWFMKREGSNWEKFYSYALDVYLNEYQLEPAMIYNIIKKDSGTAYIPVMTLMINRNGIIEYSSKEWCDRLIETIK